MNTISKEQLHNFALTMVYESISEESKEIELLDILTDISDPNQYMFEFSGSWSNDTSDSEASAFMYAKTSILTWSIWRRKYKITQLLLDHGASLSHPNNQVVDLENKERTFTLDDVARKKDVDVSLFKEREKLIQQNDFALGRLLKGLYELVSDEYLGGVEYDFGGVIKKCHVFLVESRCRNVKYFRESKLKEFEVDIFVYFLYHTNLSGVSSLKTAFKLGIFGKKSGCYDLRSCSRLKIKELINSTNCVQALLFAHKHHFLDDISYIISLVKANKKSLKDSGSFSEELKKLVKGYKSHKEKKLKPYSVKEDITECLINRKHTDLTLIAKDSSQQKAQLTVHKAIIAFYSPFFEMIIRNGIKEKTTWETSIPVSVDGFAAFISLLYQEIEDLDPVLTLSVLSLLDFYLIHDERIESICYNILRSADSHLTLVKHINETKLEDLEPLLRVFSLLDLPLKLSKLVLNRVSVLSATLNDKKITEMQNSIDTVNGRCLALTSDIEELTKKVDTIEDKLETMDTKLDKLLSFLTA